MNFAEKEYFMPLILSRARLTPGHCRDSNSVFVLLRVSDLTEWHVTSAALALVDGEPWHMHRPLTRSCALTLLTFKDANPQLVNQVLNLY